MQRRVTFFTILLNLAMPITLNIVCCAPRALPVLVDDKKPREHGERARH